MLKFKYFSRSLKLPALAKAEGDFFSSEGYRITLGGKVDHLVEDSCEAGTKTKMSGSRISQGLLVLRTAGGEVNLFRGYYRAGGGLGTLPGAPGVHRE